MYVYDDGESVTEITLAEVRQAHPNVSFPRGDIPDELMEVIRAGATAAYLHQRSSTQRPW